MKNQNTNDPKLQWIMLDAEYKRRIEQPDHYAMNDHISTFVSQDDYNFFRELSGIKDEYFDWQADQETVMEYPAVIADKDLRRKFLQIGRMLSFAFRKLQDDANSSGKDRETGEDGRIRLSVLFKMKQSSRCILN